MSRGATVAEWLAEAKSHLTAHSVPEAAANAEFIMAHILKTGRAEVRLHAQRALAEHQSNHFWHLVGQRSRRLPLAYILGTQPFMGLEIEVGEGTLIPRPETEELVAAAIDLLKSRSHEPLQLLEIGTGTGCIAIALSVAFPQAVVYATDIAPAALRLALKNAEAHHRSRSIRFIKEDLFKPDAGRRGWADLLISNPPYIPTAEIDRLDPEVLKEPRVALDGGADGLVALKAIIALAPGYLKPGGFLALEIGNKQGAAVRRLLEAAGFENPMIRKDMQGWDRIAVGRLTAGPREGKPIPRKMVE